MAQDVSEFPTQEQILQKIAGQKLNPISLKQQLQEKIQIHDQDIKKLNRLIELYDESPAVAEFAELLGIKLT